MPIVAHFYPNGEFSIGSDTSKSRRDRRNKKSTKIDPQCPLHGIGGLDLYKQWLTKYETYGTTPQRAGVGDSFVSENGYEYFLHSCDSISTTLYYEDSHGKEHYVRVNEGFVRTAFLLRLRPLVHQLVESCDKRPNRKKLVGMTKRMSRRIRNGVYLLEQGRYGKDVLSFLTLTLPNLSSESLEICCQNWDKMVKRFFDWLRITLKRKHIELQHVYCTEIQSKRLQSRNEYAPHLHVVFRGRNGKKQPWAVTPKQCRKAWKRCISAFIAERFDSSALENLQRIKRSAARYLSKYISKGCNILPSDTDSTVSQALRTQWGGMARSVSQAIERCTTRLDSDGRFSEALVFITGNLELLVAKGLLAYAKRGFIPLNKSDVDGAEYGLFVYAGALSAPTYRGGLIPLLVFVESQLSSGSN